MKGLGQSRHFLYAFLWAGVGYALLFGGIQWRRARLGPWQVMFTADAAGRPMLQIEQHRLGITNKQIVFNPPASMLPLPSPIAVAFVDPKPVPFEVPFGQCIFMDTTFLPGSVTLRLFGHTLEMLPRTLIIDKQDYLWRSNSVVMVPGASLIPTPPQ